MAQVDCFGVVITAVISLLDSAAVVISQSRLKSPFSLWSAPKTRNTATLIIYQVMQSFIAQTMYMIANLK